MKKSCIFLLVVFLSLSAYLPAQQHNGDQLQNTYFDRLGAWPYGSSIAIAADSLRDLIFLGSGGAVLVLDDSDKNNPLLISNSINTYGLVEDIYYDDQLQRLYLACGDGGFEIWDVQTPSAPVNMSRMEILYFGVETPVGHVKVKGNIAVLECAWGYIHTVDVSDPSNPFQVAFNGIVGNPAHNIHIDSQGRVHATGAQYYAILGIDNAGNITSLGQKEFLYGAGAVFGKEDIAFVGYSGSMYILDLLLPGFPAWSITDVGGIGDIEVRNNYAYILNDDGLHIWDVSNVQNPVNVGNITVAYDYKDIFLAGNYAYVGSGPKGLQIIDVTNPANPVLMATFDTYSVALGLFNTGNLTFLADAEDGLLVIDHTDPANLALVGEYSIPDGIMYQVEVRDNIAYTVCWTAGFRIIDVTDPSSPALLAADTTYDVWKLDVGGGYAYVVEVIPNVDSYIHIYDISNPSAPVEVSTTQFPSTIYEVLYNNGYLYVADYENGLRILDVSTPETPVEVAFFNYPDAFDVDIRGNILYVCAPGIAMPDGGFYTVDITDPSNPVELDQYSANGFTPFTVKAAAGYAYITDGNDIHVLDVSNPSAITYLEEYRMPDFAYDTYVDGGIIYVSDAQAGLQIMYNPQVVPVEFISFTADAVNGRVELRWVTSTESNNSGFEIQRRGSDWEKIGFVEGRGTTTEPQAYSFTDTDELSGTYSYRLKQVDYNGSFRYSDIVNISIEAPLSFSLEQNYPNPFNPSTTIKYSVPEDGFVSLKVYDILGREAAELVNERQQAGSHRVEFNGNTLVSGVYFYQLKAGSKLQIKKMLLLK